LCKAGWCTTGRQVAGAAVKGGGAGVKWCGANRESSTASEDRRRSTNVVPAPRAESIRPARSRPEERKYDRERRRLQTRNRESKNHPRWDGAKPDSAIIAGVGSYATCPQPTGRSIPPVRRRITGSVMPA